MPGTKEHLEELVRFIRENRSNESNFEKLHQKVVETRDAATTNGAAENDYANTLQETLEKYATAYKEKKADGVNAWPEFENFVTHFEKTVTQALHGA